MRYPMAILVCLIMTVEAQAQVRPMSDEAFTAVATFFSYDADVPLDGRVVHRTISGGTVREKFVFTGARGGRVPGYVAYPTAGEGPFKLVLLMHAGASSKDSWWEATGFERGDSLVRALLDRSYAVVALDAQNHGERAERVDFVPLQVLYFEKGWWATYRDMLVESTVDYRRALDYLAENPSVITSEVSVVGHSTGGLMSLYLAAIDDRVSGVVACVAALHEEWLHPLNPIDFAPRLDDEAVLILAGRNDALISTQKSERLASMITSDEKALEFFDSGHRLPQDYIGVALRWLDEHLGIESGDIR